MPGVVHRRRRQRHTLADEGQDKRRVVEDRAQTVLTSQGQNRPERDGDPDDEHAAVEQEVRRNSKTIMSSIGMSGIVPVRPGKRRKPTDQEEGDRERRNGCFHGGTFLIYERFLSPYQEITDALSGQRSGGCFPLLSDFCSQRSCKKARNLTHIRLWRYVAMVEITIFHSPLDERSDQPGSNLWMDCRINLPDGLPAFDQGRDQMIVWL